ncbi:MAG: PleD family two-component system response regulator [Planctomycetota bacterium]
MNCLECIVYRTKSVRCWEVHDLSSRHGIDGVNCEPSCEDCPFRLSRKGMRFNILLVTNDENLRSSLQDQDNSKEYTFLFANCEYECSSLMGKFQPDYVVLDNDCFGSEEIEELCEHIRNDPRIPHARIILATDSDKPLFDDDSRIYLKIIKPITTRKLKLHIH